MTNRKQAEKLAHALEDAYRKRLSETQIRKLFTDAYQEIHNDDLASTTIEDFLNGWIARKKNEISPSAWQKYQVVIKNFLAYLGDTQHNDLNFLTPRNFIGFREATIERLSPASANLYLKVLRVAFNDAWRDNLMLENPEAKVPTAKRVAGAGKERRAFNLNELKRLLAASTDDWKGMILCGLYTGQRLGDIARLTWTNIDLAQQQIFFVTSKTDRPVNVPLAQPLHDYLLQLSAPDRPDAPVFPSASAIVEKTGKTGQLSNQFYEIMVAANLAPPRSHSKRKDAEATEGRRTNELSFHCLRHTATSLLKNAGVSEAVAMDIIGHDSKAISRTYTHIEFDAKKRALDSLPHFS
ncbi:MAG: tyrosine-type recombinase/integrase [Verrucomicrobiota bacterium JB022]|nr:tyrosine-type recombinase/integrase [Verrucomicrobiota bacterium JB022]